MQQLRIWKKQKNEIIQLAKEKMRKIIVFLIFLMIIGLTIGCQKEESAEKKSVYEGGVASVDTSDTESQTENIKPAKQEMSKELKDLIAKADSVTSLQYDYSSFVQGGVDVFIKFYIYGDKMKQVYPIKAGAHRPDERFDTVYLDLSKKTAKAYCEDADHCEDITVLFSVDYNDYLVQTPLDMLNSIDYAEIVGSDMYDKKETKIVEFNNKKGNTQKVWIWDYKGLPLKSEEYDQDDELIERVEYKDLIFNQLKERDVVHS